LIVLIVEMEMEMVVDGYLIIAIIHILYIYIY